MAIEGIPNGAAVNPAMITLDQEKKKPESSAEAVQKDQESLAAIKSGKETKDAAPKVDEKYMERVQKALDLSNVGREYKVYDKLGKLYIRVYDKESGEVIREIPPEDLAELAKSLQETSGVLVNRKV